VQGSASPPGLAIRDARDSDAAGLIALIGACFAEYPGCVLDVDGELPELRRIATAFAADDGRFWVAEDDGLIVGCAGVAPCERGAELKKLYVARSQRGRGLGGAFCERVEAHARECGASLVELWSDTRFSLAHRLYEGLGYRRSQGTRVLHDRSDTIEYHFERRLP